MNGTHFVYRLIPPRPTFTADMSQEEQAIMAEHAAHWSDLFEDGSVVVFGVVMERDGVWGLAVVEAENEDAGGEARSTSASCPGPPSALARPPAYVRAATRGR